MVAKIFAHSPLILQTHTHTQRLTDVMLAAATISLFLTSLLQRMTVTKATTQTPRSGHRRRNTLQGLSKGSLWDIHMYM